MPSRSLDDLHPNMQPLAQQFLQKCQDAGIDVFLTCTYRSGKEQDADYAKGRTAPGQIITNAKGGQSAHNCTNENGSPAAKAFDFAIKDDDGRLDWDAHDADWQKAISIGKSLGLVSGGDWKSIKDWPHMELKNWKTS